MLPIAILAGGLATRLRPVTETIPKALVEIGGEPFLAHQLRLLARAGYRQVVLCVGYRADQIRKFAGDGAQFGVEIDYSPDGPQLLGTAGAIRRALPLLGPAFAVVYGDSYLTCDYVAAERVFLDSGKLGLMTVYRNEGQWDTSNVEFTGRRIVAYDKANRTPAMRYIDYGLGMFRSAAFDTVPEDRPSDLAGLYQDLLRRDELAAWESPDRFYEIGSREGIRDLEEFLSR
jgi:NDP-sugar pyrophosphorylase family protein